jgi:tRNA(fMet)-specific endonuclease VapC
MIDTNICIYVIKNRPAQLRDRFNSLADQLSISVVSLAELIYGAEKSARPHDNLIRIEEFCARLDVLPFSERAATHYGQLRAELEQSGAPVGIHDMMIGAHARSEGLTVVTNNEREFKRMPGLRVENWLQQ